MGKLTDTAVAAANHAPAPKIPTSEQIRMAQLLVDPKSEDHSSLKDKVRQVMELTSCDENSAFIALHDCDNDVEQAVVNILEGDRQQAEWIVQEGKKAKKSQTHPTSENGPDNDSFKDYERKASANRRQRGSRGGGALDGGPRRGRGGAPGPAFDKENNSRGEFGDGERSAFSGNRGRGARDDRGGRGRGFGGRGSRRGGGGFSQNDGGGFAQIGSWNSAAQENNTWDNSMANTVSNGPAGEWGKRRNKESKTWINSMATADPDWSGEEDWSTKLRGSIVFESSSVGKSVEKPLPSGPSTGLPQATVSVPAAVSGDSARVRGESIDVNSLFGSSQPLSQQSPASTAWTSNKQATVDLKNELGIGKVASPALSESTSHCHHTRDSLQPRLNAAKVELPSARAASSLGPIDVQFGDMRLGADSSKGLFDFTAPTTYQQENKLVPAQQNEQLLHYPQQQQLHHPAYHRPTGGDRVNGPDLLSSTRPTDTPKVDVNQSPYGGAGSFSSQPLEQQSVRSAQQKAAQHHSSPPQAQQQQQFASSRVSQLGTNQVTSALPQRTNSDIPGVNSEHQRSQLLSSTNSGVGAVQGQHTSERDSSSGRLVSRDDIHQTKTAAAPNAATGVPTSKNEIATGATATQGMTAYQQAMPNVYSYMLDPTLSYLQQNLYNSGAYDMRAISSVTGTNMTIGRETSGDMKGHVVRQENGQVAPSGAGAPANVSNLSMPPPGLPAPTASNAEAAMSQFAALYPAMLNVNYAAASPFFNPSPQFYVPNVSSASGPAGGNQYQRGGGYQQAPAVFGNSGYEDMQQLQQHDYGKTNYGALQPSAQGKPVPSSGGGSGIAISGNDIGNKYGGGVKGPYDSKQFGQATAPPSLSNMNYTPTGNAPAHFNYGYMQPVMNMMPPPGLQPNAQIPSDLLNQRPVNQNGKPPGGPGGVGKNMNQYPYWGN